MSVFNSKISRRDAVRGACAGAIAAVAPFSALAEAAKPQGSAALSLVAVLCERADALRGRMAPHAASIEAAFANGGIPGWMRLKGRVNSLGHERYETLIAILKATPTSIDDLAIVARVVRDDDIVHGPRSWAHAQFDQVSRDYHLAA